jgi:hypothetical protein
MLTATNSAERFDDTSSSDDDYFVGSDRAGESDFCSRDGAHALQAKIEAYWAERGQKVQIMLHNVGFHPAIRAAPLTCVATWSTACRAPMAHRSVQRRSKPSRRF